jgi:hypothetical protein
MTDEIRKLGELKFTLLSNHLRGHLGPWDEKYRQMDVHEHLKDVLRYLVEWKAEALPFIKAECGRLSDHIAVCEMEIEAGTFCSEGVFDPADYIRICKAEHSTLLKLLEINL